MPLAFCMRCRSRTRSSGPMPVCLTPPPAAASLPFGVLNLRLASSSAAFAVLLPSLPILRIGLVASALPHPRLIESA